MAKKLVTPLQYDKVLDTASLTFSPENIVAVPLHQLKTMDYTTPEYSEQIPGFEKSEFERYLPEAEITPLEGMAPMIEERAQNQGWGEQLGHGVVKGLGLAATTFLAPFTSLPLGIAEALTTGKFNKVYDNEISNKFDEFNNWMEETFPNYYTQEEQNAGAFSPKNWFTMNFLSDKLLKNVGFTVGAIAGGGVISKSIQGLGKLAMGARYTEELAKVQSLASEYVAQGMNEAKAFTTAIDKVGNGIKLINTLSQQGALLASAGAEASMEALGAKQQTMKQLVDDFVASHGYEPSEEDVDKMEDYASAAGNLTFAANMGILYGSDAVQFGKYLKGFKDERKLLGKIAERTPEVFKSTDKIRLWDKIKPFKGLVTEAAEEGSQTFTSTASQDYFARDYVQEKGDYLSKKYDLEAYGQSVGAIDSIVKGLEHTFGSKEGLESMLLGALTGGLSSVATGEARRDLQESRERVENSKAVAANLTNLFNNDNFKSIVRGQSIINDMDEALVKNDKFTYLNSKFDLLKNAVQTAIDGGKYDVLVDKIDRLKNLPQEEFNEYIGLPKENTKTPQEYISKLLNKVEAVKKAKESVDERFAGFSSDVREKAFDIVSNIQDRSQRITEVENELFKVNIPELSLALKEFSENKAGTTARKESGKIIDKILKDKADIFAQHNIHNAPQLVKDLVNLVQDRQEYADEYKNILTGKGVEKVQKKIDVVKQVFTETKSKEQQKKEAYSTFVESNKNKDNVYLLKVPSKESAEEIETLTQVEYTSPNGESKTVKGAIDSEDENYYYFKESGKPKSSLRIEKAGAKVSEITQAKTTTKTKSEKVVARLKDSELFAEVNPDGTETGRTFKAFDLFDKLGVEDVVDLSTLEGEDIPLDYSLFKYDPSQDSDNWNSVGRGGMTYTAQENYDKSWYGEHSRKSVAEFNRTTGGTNKDWYRAISNLKFEPGSRYLLKTFTYKSWLKAKEEGLLGEEYDSVFDASNPEEVKDDTIKVVLLEDNKGVLSPIIDGSTGKTVSTSLMLASAYVGDKFRFQETEREDKETLDKRIEEHQQFRDFVINNVNEGKEVLLEVTGKSRGIPNNVIVDGKRQRFNILGRIISDWSQVKDLSILVATGKNDKIISGNTAIRTTPGLTYFEDDKGNVIPAMNRAITGEEATLIMKLLKLYASNSVVPIEGSEAEKKEIKKDRTTVTAKDQDGNNIEFNILKQVSDLIYFGSNYKLEAKKGNKNPKTLIFIQRGYLYFSGADADIEYVNGKPQLKTVWKLRFKPEDLQEELTQGENSELYKFLTSLAHQVVKVKLDNADSFDKIVDITDEGVVKVEHFDSYKEYLVKGDNPVLGTSIVEKDGIDSQFNSINLYYNYPKEAISKPKTKSQTTIKSKPPTKIKRLPTQNTVIFDPEFGELAIEEAAYTGTTTNEDVSKQTKGIKFSIPKKEAGGTSEEKSETITDNSIYDTDPFAGFDFKEKPEFDVEDAEEWLRLEDKRESDKLEDLESFKTWFSERMPETLQIKTVADIIDGKAMGKVQDGVTYMWEEAEEGTGFHEAFHNVSQYILTAEERTQLYNQYKQENPGFKGDVEEALAEEFRHYMLSLGEKKYSSKVKESIFKKILDWIRDFYNHFILGDVTTIDEVFDKIQAGKYKSAKVTTTLNNKILYSLKGKTEQETKEILSWLSGIFAKRIFSEGESIENLFTLDPTDKVNINGIYDSIEKDILKTFKTLWDKDQQGTITRAEKIKAFNYRYMLENWSLVKKQHAVYFNSQYGIKTKIEEGEIFTDILDNTGDDVVKAKDSLGITEANKYAPEDSLPKPIKMLIGTLPKLNANKQVVIGDTTGLSQTVDFDRTYNFVLSKLAGLTSLTDMINELKKYYSIKPELENIAVRLKYNEGDNSALTMQDVLLQNKFVQAFAKTQDVYDIMLVDEQGKIYTTDAVSTRTDNKIKEAWETNVRTGKFTTIKDEDIFIDYINLTANLKKRFPNINTIEASATYLKMLGIEMPERFNVAELSKKEVEDFQGAVSWIRESIEKNKGKVDIFSAEADVKGRIKDLLLIAAKFSDESSNLQFINAEGETVYAVTLNNYISLITNKLNRGESIPHLEANTYSSDSIILREKRKTILGILNGMKYNKPGEEGESTKDLKLGDLLTLHINAMLKGKYLLFRPADKPSERYIDWGFFIDKKDVKVQRISTAAGIKRNLNVSDKLLDIFVQYLRTEIGRTQQLNVDNIGKNIDVYKDKAKELSFFKDIITKERFPQLETVLLGQGNVETLDLNEVKSAIKEYFFGTDMYEMKGLIGRAFRLLEDYRVLDPIVNKEGKKVAYLPLGINSDTIGEGLAKDGTVSFETAYELIATGIVNQTIAYIEQSKIFTGDIAQYADPFKRFGGMVGTKKITITDSAVLHWMDNNMKRLDGKIRDGKLNSLVYKDVEIVSDMLTPDPSDKSKSIVSSAYGKVLFNFYMEEYKDIIPEEEARKTSVEKRVKDELKEYKKITEADGQAVMTLDAFRDLMFLSESWSKKAEKAYQKAVKGERLTKKEMYFFQPQKFQYFGPQTNLGINQTTFYKYSVIPLLPSVVKGTQYESFLNSMVTNKVEMALFKSANKVGTRVSEEGKSPEFYNKDGKINPITKELVDDFNQEIDLDYFGIQVDIAPKVKHKVIWGTQMRKLALAHLFSNGKVKPITLFKDGTKVKSEEATQNLVTEYNEVVKTIIRNEKNALLDRLNLVKTSQGKYIVTNPQKFVEILTEEAISRNASDNIIYGIRSILSTEAENITIRNSFDVLPNRNKIENILMALIDNNVVKTKLHGGMKIQGASTGFEPINFNRKQIAIGDEAIKWGSNDLLFYRTDEKTGRTLPMQIKLPHFFREYYGTGKIDIKNIDKRLLQCIGYRTPTDGLSSIDSIEIVEFLPEEAGDLVILPSEIVAKAGSDYDIDKLSIFLPTYSVIPSLEEESMLALINKEISKQFPGNKSILFDTTKVDKETDRLYSIIDKKENKESNDSNITQLENAIYFAYKQINFDNFNIVYNDYASGISSREFKSNAQLQNRLIQIYKDILESPEMFPHLINAISTDVLKSRANYITWLTDVDAQKNGVTLEEYKKKVAESSTTVFEWTKNLEKWNDFLSGKKLVGQTAVHVTHHTLSQIANLRLSDKYKGLLRFKTNDELSLSQEKDTKGNYIIRTLRAFLNAAVDVAKDPFIFTINATNATAQTYFYLIRRGVDIDTLTVFMSQPIIKKYLRLQAINESTIIKAGSESEQLKNIVKTKSREKLIEEAINDTLRKAKVKTIDSLPSRGNTNFTEKELAEAIKANTLKTQDAKWAALQVQALYSFIQHTDEAKVLGELVRGTAQDRTFSKSLIENEVRNIKNDLAIALDDFENADRLVSDTFMGEFEDVAKNTNKMYEDLFVTENEVSKVVLNPIKKFFTRTITSEEQLFKILNKIKDDYVTFLIQIGKFKTTAGELNLSQLTYKILHGRELNGTKLPKGSIAEQIQNIKANPAHPLHNNLWIKEIYPIINREGKPKNVHNIKLFNRKVTTDKANSLTAAYREIYSTEPKLANGLTALAILQSGISESPIAYTKYIPIENYTKITEEIITKYANIDVNSLQPDNFLFTFGDQFFRNNWKNKLIVPHVKNGRLSTYQGWVTNFRKGHKELLVWSKFNQSRFPYVRTTVKDSEGKYTSLLYKKTLRTEGENYVYELAEPMGDGMYYKEYKHKLAKSYAPLNVVNEDFTYPFRDIVAMLPETVRAIDTSLKKEDKPADWREENLNCITPF